MKKTTRLGTYTVAVALIVLATIILVNALVASLPTKYTVIDTSAEKLYSISDSTRKALSILSENVTIYYLCPNGAQDETFRAFLDRYTSENSRISIQVVDPIANPTFVMKYTEAALSEYSIIIEGPNRFKVIDYSEIYEFDYYYYLSTGEQKFTFNGERCITSAIDYVTTNKLPEVYYLTGHGEMEISETLASQIDDLNYSLSSLSLLSMEKVPDDASAVIICAPTSDLNEADAQKLISYLDAGGKIFVITRADRPKLQNLFKVTSHYGLTLQEGLIIEGDSSKAISGYPYWLLPDITSHNITSSLKDNTFIQLPTSHPIISSEITRDGLNVTPLFTTSDKAYTVALTAESMEKTENSDEGTFTVGAIAEETGKGALVWFSTDAVLDETVNAYSSGANYQYLLSVVRYLSPRDTIITDIPSVDLEDPVLTVPESSASFWSIMLTAVIPLAFLGIGLTKWMIRRRK